MKRVVVLLLLAAAAAPVAAEQCTLEYQRADNMWADHGRPDGPLGVERLTLEPGQTKVFTTDWKYEKQANDGTNYYGSHVRIVRNAGKGAVKLVFRGDDLQQLVRGALRAAITHRDGKSASGMLDPGIRLTVRADLMEASCPEEAKATIVPPAGLSARQMSPTQIVLTWQPVPAAKEYHVYVDPPASPTMAGRPGVAGGKASRWVITVPPSVPSSTVYRASIETVAANGAKSQRVEFNPVALMAAPGLGGTPQTGGGPTPGGTPQTGGGPTPGGTPSTPSGPRTAGQQCPPGQFVSGFTGTGALICASPPR